MENFVVSARKYRPITFQSVVGQGHITSTLKNAIERGQLAHAYLFCGPRGVGKTTCARIFAKSINCLDPQNGSEPCGECESCVAFSQNRSLNIHELDAASNNSVEDIRSLIDQVRIIPQVGRYALFIIDEVHMLSTAAFNAFLKTLEEPPAHAIFILATTERHKILPTILSRCQCYDFNRIRVEDGAEYLRYIADQEGVTIDDESLNLIAQKADGGMRDALSMFDKAVSFGGTTLDFHLVSQTLGVVDYDTYFRLTDRLLAGDYHSALVTFDGVLSGGFDLTSFLTGFARHLRDLLVACDQQTRGLMELSQTMLERYRAQAAECTVEFLFGALGVLTRIDCDLRRSSNQRLLIELGLMKIAGLGQKKNIEGFSFDDKPLPLATITQPQGEVKREESRVEVQKAEVVEVVKAEVVEESRVEEPKAAPVKRAPLFSLRTALSTPTTSEEEEQPEEVEQSSEESDKRDEEQLLAAKDRIYTFVVEQRPRFAQAFGSMQIAGRQISVEVATEELSQEIRRSESDLLASIKEMVGVEGRITLQVVVNETIRAKRPIKLEDRVAHFTRLNPKIIALTEALDLQIDG
ncbi:MAG: DNA polymerase III subunit gamma/tau [Rikenellaceae bacterium]